MTGTPEPELPEYSTRSSFASQATPWRSEHVCSLQSKGRQWISIFVKSRSTNATLAPLFLEHDVITGRVKLDLDKSETVKAVTISVQAGTTSVGQEELLFLDIRQDLWTPALTGGGKPSSSKLKGQYSWPFTFTLPSEVLVSEAKGKQGVYHLPPTFSERASPAYIDYRLSVTIKRGTLRMDQTLTTNFGYLPASRPDLPSPLRQLAYREGSSLVGPDGDPDGWKVIAPVKVSGTLFSAKEAEVICTLAIATPSCYSVGTPLPLIITFTSTDSQALDLLSAPSSIRLHLVRSTATGSDAADENVTRRSNNFFRESVGQAFFWPSSGGAPDERTRSLQGELEVKKTLKPNFLFPRLSIRYTLDLLPFEVPGFVSSIAQGHETLLSESVSIVTRQIPGISPRSHAPPGYQAPQGGDYNKSMGLLENGNQRFYHHEHGR